MSNRFRRMTGYVALALSCVMIGSALTFAPQSTAHAEDTTVTTVVHTSPFTTAIAQVRDSVVGVSNYQEVTRYSSGSSGGFYWGFGYGGRNREEEEPEVTEELASTGSGVVIGEDLVLTNYHVVEDATTLKVTIEDEEGETIEHDATLVAWDENLDAAIVHAPGLGLPAVTLGDSDTLLVGDWAICIGNPLGFTKTTTVGIVSALNRGIESETYDKYGRKETISNAMIQVDAAINSGNSGGGMFSVTGELMGIPTLKYTGSYWTGSTVEGIGMCIPINAVKPMIEEVLSGNFQTVDPEGEDEEASGDDLTNKPRMGITIADVNSSSRAAMLGQIPDGVFITEIEAGSPAEKAGMMVGDIIVDVNDTVITSTTQLTELVGRYKAGDVLQVKVYRAEGLPNITANEDAPEGEYVDLEVTLEIIQTAPESDLTVEDNSHVYEQ